MSAELSCKNSAPLNSASLKFHLAPVKSLHARSNIKFLCMPNTCSFQSKPYPSFTPHASVARYGSNAATGTDRGHFSLCLCLHQTHCGMFQKYTGSGFPAASLSLFLANRSKTERHAATTNGVMERQNPAVEQESLLENQK